MDIEENTSLKREFCDMPRSDRDPERRPLFDIRLYVCIPEYTVKNKAASSIFPGNTGTDKVDCEYVRTVE